MSGYAHFGSYWRQVETHHFTLPWTRLPPLRGTRPAHSPGHGKNADATIAGVGTRSGCPAKSLSRGSPPGGIFSFAPRRIAQAGHERHVRLGQGQSKILICFTFLSLNVRRAEPHPVPHNFSVSE